MPRNPTIHDVAERAAVSKSLVSLVMGNSPKVSEESRRAVLEAAKELGYRPNVLARGLAGSRTGIIGVILSNVSDQCHLGALRAIQDHLRAAGFRPLLMHSTRDAQLEASLIETFLDLRADALLFVDSALAESELHELAQTTPVAIIGRRVDSPDIDVVVNDEQHGAALVVDHLTELGHQRIAHIDGPGEGESEDRREAYGRAVRGHSLEPTVVTGGCTEQGGLAGVRALLEQPEMPSAIFATSDLCAIGAIDTLRQNGLQVPGDVSVVGYDDTPLAALQEISLSTVSRQVHWMGEQAAQLLVERLANPDQPARTVLTTPSFVARSTTGPPATTSPQRPPQHARTSKRD